LKLCPISCMRGRTITTIIGIGSFMTYTFTSTTTAGRIFSFQLPYCYNYTYLTGWVWAKYGKDKVRSWHHVLIRFLLLFAISNISISFFHDLIKPNINKNTSTFNQRVVILASRFIEWHACIFQLLQTRYPNNATNYRSTI
jgi:hypothetical protein